MIGIMLMEAWHALGASRLRTILTMLGMIIGVGAVTLMLGVGRGAQFQVEESISSMGSNLLIVFSGTSTSGGLRSGAGGAPTLTLDDSMAIEELPDVSAIAPMVQGAAQIVYGPNNWSTIVVGSTPGFLDVRNWELSSGYAFTDSDVRSATRVALIGQTVAKNLFGDDDPLGKTIRIKQSPYLIIGILEAKGQSLIGQDQDDTIVIPITTAQRKLFGSQFQGTVRAITVQTVSLQSMDSVQDAITQLLRQRHHIKNESDDDFTVRNMTAIINTAADVTRIMSILLGAIASVSLVVGGIGIMNIMLVSVTERTREIGIRMAIGARQQDILMQFLMEAIIISIVGCLAGVILGVSIAFIINQVFHLTVVITFSSIILAFAVAAGIGIFFGFYPANKASRMEPIEALRYQ